MNNQIDTTPLTDDERYELMEGDGCSEPDYGKEPLTNEEDEEN